LREGRGFFAGFARWIDALPGGLVFALGLGTVAVVGIVDELTGAEVGLTFFYLLPIWFASWFLGAGAGLALALASVIAWWAADIATRLYSPRPSVQAANFAMQLALFAAAALVSAAMRRRGDRESALARTDGLTGLLNRRGFLEVARREIARSARMGRPLTVALLDVDRFKEVNDVRGQEAGDHLLGGMGSALRSATRAADGSARLDGDEFAVLLPDADPLSIEAVLDRLRLVLVQAAAEKGATVTVSLGAATFDRPPSSLDEMLRAAARMLDEAKTSGRGGLRHDRVGDLASGGRLQDSPSRSSPNRSIIR
jgi:diguanylate cyclase (GGDEF)-like protein